MSARWSIIFGARDIGRGLDQKGCQFVLQLGCEGRAVMGAMAAAGYLSRPPERLEISRTSASVAFGGNELRLLLRWSGGSS
jgi:hypothetical protein